MDSYTEETSLMEKDYTGTCDSCKFSCFDYDDGPYFDMDLTLPYNGNKIPLEAIRESEEFEFSVSVSATNKFNITEYVGNDSPADDLFYRGQLLPLHLPPRLEMVRNLSSPKELEGGTDGFDRYSSRSKDSNQRPSCCRESWCRSAETEEKTHFQPMVKSATNSKVKVPMFGLSKLSTAGTDDYYNSPPLPPPPMAKPLKFMLKFKSMKAASLSFFTAYYSTEQNPDYPLNINRASTSVKHIVQKYLRLVKRRISSQRHNDAQTGNQQLKMDEECVWPCIADESGRQTNLGFRHFGAKSCLPSMNSSLNFCTEDLQSAIAYCKQSNGGIDSSNDSERPV